MRSVDGAGPQNSNGTLRMVKKPSLEGDLSCRVGLRARLDGRLFLRHSIRKIGKAVLPRFIERSPRLIAVYAARRDNHELSYPLLYFEQLAGMCLIIGHGVDNRICT